ncbi:MAG TPA: hypothetical protein VI814_01715 [Candidatus Limnocylindria bacterium]
MGLYAFIAIAVVALVAGVAVQYLFKSSHTFEWLAIAVAGTFGAYFASETFVTAEGKSATTVFQGITNWGPSFDGMFIVPAIVGGIILAIVADLGIRTMPAQRATA